MEKEEDAKLCGLERQREKAKEEEEELDQLDEICRRLSVTTGAGEV